MRKTVLVALAAVAVGGLLTAALVPEQGAAASANKKFHFTHTLESALSPGQGHETHHIVTVHAPNPGTVYDGTLVYTASTPVGVAVLHEIEPDDGVGQPVWRIDDETACGWAFVDPDSSSGTFEYAGAGLMLHTRGDEFVATVTVDGWAGGQPTEVVPQNPVPWCRCCFFF